MSEWLNKLTEFKIFDSPEEASAFGEWETNEQDRIKELCRFSKGKGNALPIYLLYLYDGVNLKYQKVKKDADEWEDIAHHNRGAAQRAAIESSRAHRAMREAINAKNKLKAELDNIRLGLETKKNLGSGRLAGTKKRTLQSQGLQQKLIKAISDLYAHGKGWKMGNKEIASYLSQNGFGQYFKFDTLRRKISPIIAGIKKAEKEKSGL